MKNLINIFALLLLVASAGCSVTQEMKDDANFDGLTKIYVENPPNAREQTSYYLNNDEINASVVEFIKEYLKERGYVPVDSVEQAQIVFRPIWNFSLKNPYENNPYFTSNINNSVSVNAFMPQYYSTLEIQAYFPNRTDWVWRGFSPLNMDRQNASSGMIKEQVRWCLEYFPPEKFPSRMQIYKKQKAEKLKEEENPFSHIKVEGQTAPEGASSKPLPSTAKEAVSAPANGVAK